MGAALCQRMTGADAPSTRAHGGASEDSGLGRLLLAVAASAALCASDVAQAQEPRADIEGEVPDEVRATIQRVVGETDDPIENRFEARRRARAAAEDAIAVLRSEGYYAYEVTPDVSDADPPRPLVRISPGPRFLFGPVGIAWQGESPDAETDRKSVV